MGGIGAEAPHFLQGSINPIEHVVNCPGQAVELVVTAAHRQALVQVFGADPVGGAGHAVDGAQRPAGQEPASAS